MLPLGLSFHSEGFSESNKILLNLVNQRRGGVKVRGREVVTHTHTSNTRRGYTALLKLTHDHIQPDTSSSWPRGVSGYK